MPLAVITGASSGIGAATAARLIADGWRVIALNRTTAAAGIETIATDLGCRAEVLAAIERLAPQPVDALIHAAGIMHTAPLGAFKSGEGDLMWRVHIEAAEILVDALGPRLPRGGRIVLVGSRAAVGLKGRSQYGATKAALTAMARSWASELIDQGITVNVVAPAATDTPMLTGAGRTATPVKLPPIGRLISPDEVAGLITYLMSRAADAITGQTITICGGSSLDA